MIVAVMVRETWTDERLDDLNKKVDDGFVRISGDIRELRGNIGELRGDIGGLRKEGQQEFLDLRKEMNERFDALNGRLLAGFFVLIAAMIGSTATLAGIAIF
jgi:hypothetical protein